MQNREPETPGSRRPLESWKAIASYLQHDVRTVQRWEHDEGLPVHRHGHRKQATVFAFRDEIDAWRVARETGALQRRPQRRWRTIVSIAAAAALLTIAAVWLSFDREEPTTGTAAPAETASPSIVVLPFRNRSGDESLDYFGAGVSDDIINLLATIPELRVTSRTSSFHVAEKNLDVPGIAGELDVDHVLEGSVWRDGDRIRVAANLIDAATDTQVDAFRFERPVGELFDIQDEIATAIARQLRVSLGRIGEQARRTANLRAEQLYLKARFESRKRTASTMNEAVALLLEAIRIDPAFAAAHAELAGVYLALPGYSQRKEDRIEVLFPKALESAREALELDPMLSKPYAVLAARATLATDFVGGRELAERALALSPNDPEIRVWFGMLLLATGDTDFAFEQFQWAHRVDPLSAMTNRFMGIGLRILGRDDEAVAYLDTAIELGGVNANYVRALAHIDDREFDLARKRLEVWSLSHGIDPEWASVFVGAFEDRYTLTQAIGWIERLERRHRDIGAATYASLGALDQAFASATQEIASGSAAFLFNVSDPELSAFRRDPRFAELVGQTGLVGYWDTYGWDGYCWRAAATLTCR